jgi:hypothetical protein
MVFAASPYWMSTISQTISTFRWVSVVFLPHRELSWSALWHDRRQNVKCQQQTAFKRFQSGLGGNPRLAPYESIGCRRFEKEAGRQASGFVRFLLFYVRSSQQWLWRALSSEMLRRRVWRKFTDVSDKPSQTKIYKRTYEQLLLVFVCCFPTTIKWRQYAPSKRCWTNGLHGLTPQRETLVFFIRGLFATMISIAMVR